MLIETMPAPPVGWKYGGMKIVKTGDMYYSFGMGWIKADRH